jgi:hypothetical protein
LAPRLSGGTPLLLNINFRTSYVLSSFTLLAGYPLRTCKRAPTSVHARDLVLEKRTEHSQRRSLMGSFCVCSHSVTVNLREDVFKWVRICIKGNMHKDQSRLDRDGERYMYKQMIATWKLSQRTAQSHSHICSLSLSQMGAPMRSYFLLPFNKPT